MRIGYSLEQIYQLTKIDRWFLWKLKHIMDINRQLREFACISEWVQFMDRTELMEYLEEPRFLNLLYEAKKYGFSDFQIARAIGLENGMNMEKAGLMVRKWREELGVTPVVNQIDTLAAEYPAQTNYLYLSYL